MGDWHGLAIGLAAAGATAFAAFLGWLGTRSTRLTQREENADERWAAQLAAQTLAFDKQFAAQTAAFNAQLAPLVTGQAELRTQVRELQDLRELDAAKFRVAIKYIRILLAWSRVHAPEETLPPIPEQLVDEV